MYCNVSNNVSESIFCILRTIQELNCCIYYFISNCKKVFFFAVKYLNEVCHKISNVMLIVFKETFGQHFNFKYLKQKKKKMFWRNAIFTRHKNCKKHDWRFFCQWNKIMQEMQQKATFGFFLQRSKFTVWSSISFNID